MYFPRNWKFGSALSKLRNFGGFELPSVRYWSSGNCYGDAGLGLDPYGPVQINPVWHSHFDIGYANFKQPHT
jgi:hypothetical protein